jgi:MFS family permease
MFRSLRAYNFRVWTAGALVSNVGTWMQRTAQDWIVLTQLTDHDAAAVGIVTALQFAPQLLLLPVSGVLVDRVDQRKLLMVTQATMGALGLVLGILTVTGVVQLWHVFVFAFLLGCTSAFDVPARQTFVGQLVGKENISNAVALNSASFNSARMIGPAVAGLLVALIGSGWVFLLNALSFAAVLVSMLFLKPERFTVVDRARKGGNLREALSYVRSRPDLSVVLVVMFLIGTFGLNFPIFISTMTTIVYGGDAAAYGIISSVFAVGSVTGALLSARRESPRLRYLFGASAIFAIGCALAAFAPGYWWFAAALVVIGVASQTIMTTANGYMQLSTPQHLRGRVISIYLAVLMGGTPIGGPIVGWVANEFGPRWSLGVAAGGAALAAAIGLFWLVRYRGVRLRYSDRRLRFSVPPAEGELLTDAEEIEARRA